VARKITVSVSVATSGSLWEWLLTAYNGLYTRFEGNLDLVATHMKLLDCYTFDSVDGLSNYSATFVTDKNLITMLSAASVWTRCAPVCCRWPCGRRRTRPAASSSPL
jgi:hypothetical protein